MKFKEVIPFSIILNEETKETMAIVADPASQDVMATGIARLESGDVFDEETGQMIALGKAFRQLGTDLLAAGYERDRKAVIQRDLQRRLDGGLKQRDNIRQQRTDSAWRKAVRYAEAVERGDIFDPAPQDFYPPREGRCPTHKGNREMPPIAGVSFEEDPREAYARIQEQFDPYYCATDMLVQEQFEDGSTHLRPLTQWATSVLRPELRGQAIEGLMEALGVAGASDGGFDVLEMSDRDANKILKAIGLDELVSPEVDPSETGLAPARVEGAEASISTEAMSPERAESQAGLIKAAFGESYGDGYTHTFTPDVATETPERRGGLRRLFDRRR